MAFNVISFEFLCLLKTLDEILMFDIGLEFCIIIHRILSFSYVSICYVYVKCLAEKKYWQYVLQETFIFINTHIQFLLKSVNLLAKACYLWVFFPREMYGNASSAVFLGYVK